ncbi:nuclease-related domain-containing protein [Arthrobacter silvisoli]|uniref:nuclease-related domain-containing protein n=1 Tax=Arthrobacter silvisoli TaxID=2291022 RepID=UPI0014447C1B|nr:nuclease-related domain-containing protein [Arthrobacter silvisoli]
MPDHSQLRHHVPGQSVMHQVMALQESTPAQPAIGRIFGVSPLTAEAKPWYRGAIAEIAVGEILSALGPEWSAFHAIPVGSGTSDIDHVVIGPGGVFTLNTKNHTGHSVWVAGRTLMVSGSKQRHIPNSQFEAQRASKLLTLALGHPVTATAVLVIFGAKSLTIKEQPAGVVVLSAPQLTRWLRRQPQVLSSAETERLAAVAGNPRLWHRNPPPAVDPRTLQTWFKTLQQQVRRAALIRAGWVLATCLVLAVAIFSRH